MKINIKELQKREKYINCQKHDSLDLFIWNYNHFCQFDRAWDEYTEQARGLVTNLEGNIVARPFRKFFNLNEHEKTKIENLPNELPEIMEKYDGSLGIQYYDNDKVCITTRGSFNSDQAIWATEWMKKFDKLDFMPGFTYLYEIIYPENRIVVNYGERAELVLLAIISLGTEVVEIDYRQEAKRLNLNFASVINNTLQNLITEMKKLSANEEGFVLKYKNGLRVKMKGDEYVRLHRLITGFSTKSIWECLKNGDSIEDILQDVPDEFFKWTMEKRDELMQKAFELKKRAQRVFLSALTLPTRKEQALAIMKNHKDISGLVFGLLDNKNIHEQLWKSLKPKWELPFKKEI